MMGWFLILLCVLLIMVLLWRFGKVERPILEVTAAALMLAVAGYSWLGSPGLSGSPRRSAAAEQKGEAPPAYRVSGTGSGAFLQSVDDNIGAGRTRAAVDMVRAEIDKNPNDPDLWVALGQALFAHGGDHMSAAAEMAFHRAAEMAPNHPGPPFFLGFAQAQAGNYEEAASIWRAMLARAPANAPWKADLEARLAEITPLIAAPSTPSSQTAN